jgi:hypothetical protein
MSTALEQAWKAAGSVWRSEEFRAQSPAALLRARLDRQTRRMRWIVATLVVLLAAAAAIIKSGGAGAVRLSAMVLLYTGAIWTFALWNRRGTWSPYGESTADFVALLRVRTERRMKSARVCISVVAIAALVASREVEAAWRAGTMTASAGGIWIAFGVYSVGIVVWGIWYLKRGRRELQALAAMERELEVR